MKHNYQAKEGGYVLLEPGDYILKVESVEEGYCQSGKSAGAQKLTIRFSSPNAPGGKVDDILIDSASMSWKTDMFITTFSLTSKVGENVELNESSMVGLQGWCYVIQEESTSINPLTNKPYINNKVGRYLTKSTKLPRIMPAPKAPEHDPMTESARKVKPVHTGESAGEIFGE